MVCYMALWECNHTYIRVISTPTVSYNTPLVWYAHFIFYSVGYIDAVSNILTHSVLVMACIYRYIDFLQSLVVGSCNV